MPISALLFVGAVLLINGLVLLGKIEPKSATSINILVGGGLAAAAAYLVIPLDLESPTALPVIAGAVGFTLFSLTYLTVAFNALAGTPGKTLGWYCGWAVLISAFLAVYHFATVDDPRMAALWTAWTVLFLAFFLAIVVRPYWGDSFAGMLAIIQSFTTCTIPAMLQIADGWTEISPIPIAAVQAFGIAFAFWWASRRAGERPGREPNKTGRINHAT